MTTANNIFEAATRNKFRFPFRGIVSVEDLWDLTPENLDIVFKNLNTQKSKAGEESLLANRAGTDEELLMKIDIVKHIVAVKLNEAEVRNKAAEKRAKKQMIMSIINEKQNDALHNMSVDELTAMLSDLDD